MTGPEILMRAAAINRLSQYLDNPVNCFSHFFLLYGSKLIVFGCGFPDILASENTN